jgi:hypothetical protein
LMPLNKIARHRRSAYNTPYAMVSKDLNGAARCSKVSALAAVFQRLGLDHSAVGGGHRDPTDQ